MLCRYNGFQVQNQTCRKVTTVQQRVEEAVCQISQQSPSSLRMQSAGRTDTGVHARGQASCSRHCMRICDCVLLQQRSPSNVSMHAKGQAKLQLPVPPMKLPHPCTGAGQVSHTQPCAAPWQLHASLRCNLTRWGCRNAAYLMQAVNFYLFRKIDDCHTARFQLNRLLPPSIRVTHLQRVPPDFHCRYSALSKVGSRPYQAAHALQSSPSHPAAFTSYATSPLRILLFQVYHYTVCTAAVQDPFTHRYSLHCSAELDLDSVR